MPGHIVHFYVDRACFGKVYYRVHRDMDSAYQYFRGKHRIFFHDVASACAIAANNYPGDRNAVSSALLHIEIDRLCSADPFFHRQLWLLAKEDAIKRKQAKKRNTRPKKRQSNKAVSEIEKTEKILKQLLELKRLIWLIRS